MKTLKKHLAMLTAMTSILAAGCAGNQSSEITDLESAISASSGSGREDSAVYADPVIQTADASSFSAELTKADLNTGWDERAAALEFAGETVTPSATDGLTVENSVVTITKGGTYVLSGTLDNGRVVVDLTDETEKVHLIFNGVSLHSNTSAPLTILKADKAVITLAAGTENKLSDAEEYTAFDEDTEESRFPAACIASKADLTFNGTGSLTVESSYHNGIHCKDDLKIVSGVINVTAKNHGIRGNDSVLIHDGTVTVQSGGDGIKTSTADTDGKGVIYIEDGSVRITSEQDGMDAATDLTVAGGVIAVSSGGGTENAPQRRGETGGFGGGRGDRIQTHDTGIQPTAVQQSNRQTADTALSEENAVSTKGCKAAGTLTVSGGSVSVDSADDALHSDSTALICGSAELALAAGGDGIRADTALYIKDDAAVTISQSYEGLEAYHIVVSGGNTHINASDDGINATGTTGENASGSSGILELNGGYLYVDAEGDGLDSNGDISMTGGTVIVCGPTNDGNGSFDCGDNQNKITVTGGTLMAVGSTGMMDVPESSYIAATNANAAAGTLIVATDADGNVLGALKTPKQAEGVIFSAEGLSDGYSIYTGGSYEGDFNSDGFAVGGSYEPGTLVAFGSGGGGSLGGFGKGQHGGGRGQQEQDGMPEMPDGNFPGGFPEQNQPFGKPGGTENSISDN